MSGCWKSLGVIAAGVGACYRIHSLHRDAPPHIETVMRGMARQLYDRLGTAVVNVNGQSYAMRQGEIEMECSLFPAEEGLRWSEATIH